MTTKKIGSGGRTQKAAYMRPIDGRPQPSLRDSRPRPKAGVWSDLTGAALQKGLDAGYEQVTGHQRKTSAEKRPLKVAIADVQLVGQSHRVTLSFKNAGGHGIYVTVTAIAQAQETSPKAIQKITIDGKPPESMGLGASVPRALRAFRISGESTVEVNVDFTRFTRTDLANRRNGVLELQYVVLGVHGKPKKLNVPFVIWPVDPPQEQ